MSYLNDKDPMYQEVMLRVILADITTKPRDVADAMHDAATDRDSPLWGAYVAIDIASSRTLTEKGCADVLNEMKL